MTFSILLKDMRLNLYHPHGKLRSVSRSSRGAVEDEAAPGAVDGGPGRAGLADELGDGGFV